MGVWWRVCVCGGVGVIRKVSMVRRRKIRHPSDICGEKTGQERLLDVNLFFQITKGSGSECARIITKREPMH